MQSLFLPVVALGFAVSPVAGQNVGARKPDRVEARSGRRWGMAVGLMVVSAIVCYTLRRS